MWNLLNNGLLTINNIFYRMQAVIETTKKEIRAENMMKNWLICLSIRHILLNTLVFNCMCTYCNLSFYASLYPHCLIYDFIAIVIISKILSYVINTPEPMWFLIYTGKIFYARHVEWNNDNNSSSGALPIPFHTINNYYRLSQSLHYLY